MPAKEKRSAAARRYARTGDERGVQKEAAKQRRRLLAQSRTPEQIRDLQEKDRERKRRKAAAKRAAPAVAEVPKSHQPDPSMGAASDAREGHVVGPVTCHVGILL